MAGEGEVFKISFCTPWIGLDTLWLNEVNRATCNVSTDMIRLDLFSEIVKKAKPIEITPITRAVSQTFFFSNLSPILSISVNATNRSLPVLESTLSISSQLLVFTILI